MAEIRPFRGVHYNTALLRDLAAVICPPYDIITPEMQKELHQRSDYNFVRLEFSFETARDTSIDNRYTRAAKTLKQWLEQDVLSVDDKPAIYLHDHYFTHQGEKWRRRGITVVVRLEEWSKMVVRPHEGTLTKPKGDRLALLWELQANTSPILALYEDDRHLLSSLLEVQAQYAPMLEVKAVNEESHRVWAITDVPIIRRICSRLADKPVYIADGHHRYESALTYRNERRACAASVSGEEPFNFVMMTLVDLADPGLVILPAHRLVCGIPETAIDGLVPKMREFFDLDEILLNKPDAWQKADASLADSGMLALLKEKLFALRVKDFAAVSRMMPYFHSDIYKKLNISIVDHVILEELLGLVPDKEGACLAYSHDRQDVVSKVLSGEYQAAFLLSPVKPEAVKAIADAGDGMPRKSTYFYPKLPSGLIFYQL